MPDPVVVIGGGIGGLSAAIRLAAAGQSVTLLEQNSTVGGKMSQVCADGFRWDTGPSVITMRPVLEDLFAAAGRKLEDYLTLLPMEPLTRYFYPDGVVLDASRDLSKMAAQIEALDGRDVEGYLAYLAYAARLHRITGPVFIYDQPPTLRSFARVSPLDALKVDAWRTMDGAIKSFVRSPHLRQLLGRFATYVGASPYRAPATLNVIAHVEMTGGVWYPQGGVYRIAEALARLARELGVDIRTGCPVRQINTDAHARVQGVTLADGTTMSAQAVIANVDVATVYERLLPGLSPRPEVEPSCSGFIMLLGIEGQHPQLAHHNIFFSSDYPAEFKAIFEQGKPPDEPTIYIAITSKSDPHDAPPGCENWFVLVNAPALDSRFDWTAQAEAYGDRVLARLAAMGLDVRGQIRSKRLLTPVDLE
ncbi:MAG: phytoene desaturase, partial [Anaerolineae bacterium]|nr:phytoene desaturase [Anaerolineae bacterium]